MIPGHRRKGATLELRRIRGEHGSNLRRRAASNCTSRVAWRHRSKEGNPTIRTLIFVTSAAQVGARSIPQKRARPPIAEAAA
jgi:hypothetical protein